MIRTIPVVLLSLLGAVVLTFCAPHPAAAPPAATASGAYINFAQVAEELRHVYVLAYSPSNPQSNGGYRSIQVKVVSNPDATVRHRLGYQATP